MIAIGAAMLKYYPADGDNPLSTPEPVDDETAKLALRNFFEAVLQADGETELRRLYESFYLQAHGVRPPLPKSWADDSPDGVLKAKPGANAASNGK